MAIGREYLKRKTRSTFITSMLIISLVLFIMGIFTLGIIYSNHLLKSVQEEFEMMVFLKEGISTERRKNVQTEIGAETFVKDIRYVSKEEASKEFMETVGDDFLEIMQGVNPIPASLNIKVRADHINRGDQMTMINSYLRAFPEVTEVEYPFLEIEQIRNNMGTMIKLSIGLGLLVLLIAFFIISATLKLAIYSKRLVIRSMQLIGATAGFIRRPFVTMGTLQGLLGGIIASVLLCVAIMVFSKVSPLFADLGQIFSISEFYYLMVGLLIFGALIGYISSNIAVSRYLYKNLDELM